MYIPAISNKQKNLEENLFFVGILKACNEKIRVKWAVLNLRGLKGSMEARRAECRRISCVRYLYSSAVDLHWFQCGSGSNILGQCWSGSRGLMPINFKILLVEKTFKKIFSAKIAIPILIIPKPLWWTSKRSQLEASSLQKITSSTSKHEIY